MNKEHCIRDAFEKGRKVKQSQVDKDDDNRRGKIINVANFVAFRAGSCETEVIYGDEAEADLTLYHFQRCTKNAEHKNFFHVSEFTPKHLPDEYSQDGILFSAIKSLADVTVRLSVECVSTNRPEFYENGDPFPFSEYRGQTDMKRFGTGWADFVFRYKDFAPDSSCGCRSCRDSGVPQKKVGRVKIITAAHVVFDKQEGDHTTCHLLYDNEHPDLESCLALSGPVRVESFIEDDRCFITYEIHDMNLLKTLLDMWQPYRSRRIQVSEKYISHNSVSVAPSGPATTPIWYNPSQSLAIIVSHPHGDLKMISVGDIEDREEVRKHGTQYTYTTPTCDGSSGAPVFIVGKKWLAEHPHRRWLSLNPQKNQSAIYLQ